MDQSSDDFEADLEAPIDAALQALAPLEASVLDLYFGLSDRDPLTLDEIARQLDLPLPDVKALKDRALVALRRWIRGGEGGAAGTPARLGPRPPDPLVDREPLPGGPPFPPS